MKKEIKSTSVVCDTCESQIKTDCFSLGEIDLCYPCAGKILTINIKDKLNEAVVKSWVKVYNQNYLNTFNHGIKVNNENFILLKNEPIKTPNSLNIGIQTINEIAESYKKENIEMPNKVITLDSIDNIKSLDEI